ncbi:MAG: ribosome small subunit-dependent GTPase A [Frankiaceae bacterium]
MRYDEDDVRVRPGRGTRPRTKERPRHADATTGFVTAVDRGRFTCLVGGSPVVAMRARELGRHSVVVGDRVALVGDVSSQRGSLARIVRIEPRSSVLRRTADDVDPVERVIVAGADQLVVVMSLADPDPVPRLVDRCLVAAYDAGIDPLLCLTKADLASPDALLAAYEPLGVAHVVLGTDETGTGPLAGLGALRDRLAGRISVLVGHSGVGKSTIVNELVPEARRRTGTVNDVTGRGRHTSSSAVALPLPEGGWVVDTPGVRSFGLAHVGAATVLEAFPELYEAAADCPTDCAHTDAAVPECALDAAVASGRASPARLASFRRLLESRPAHEGD